MARNRGSRVRWLQAVSRLVALGDRKLLEIDPILWSVGRQLHRAQVLQGADPDLAPKDRHVVAAASSTG